MKRPPETPLLINWRAQATREEMHGMREELATLFDFIGWKHVAVEVRALPDVGSERWGSQWVSCLMCQAWRLGLAGRDSEGDMLQHRCSSLACLVAEPIVTVQP